MTHDDQITQSMLYLRVFDGHDRVLKKQPILWPPEPSMVVACRSAACEIRRRGSTLHWMWTQARTAERQIAHELASTPRALAGNQRTLRRIARQLAEITADLAYIQSGRAPNRRGVATDARTKAKLEVNMRKVRDELASNERRRRELLGLKDRGPEALQRLRELTRDCELAGSWTDPPLDVALKIVLLLDPAARLLLGRAARRHRAVVRAAHDRGLIEAYPDGLVPFVFTYAHRIHNLVRWRAVGAQSSDHIRALTRLWFGSCGSQRRLSSATLAHFRALDAPALGSAREWRDEHGCMNRLCDPSDDSESAQLTRFILADPLLSALTLTSAPNGTRRCYRMIPMAASPTHRDVVAAINSYVGIYDDHRQADIDKASHSELDPRIA